MGTYADVIYRNALLYPDREAFAYNSEGITFSQFNTRVNSLIHALQSLGMKKGDTISILSYNCLEYADVYEAAVIGLPDPYWVEKVHAVVALKQEPVLPSRGLSTSVKRTLPDSRRRNRWSLSIPCRRTPPARFLKGS